MVFIFYAEVQYYIYSSTYDVKKLIDCILSMYWPL